MIYDDWENFAGYAIFSKEVAQAIADFKANAGPELKNGTYELQGRMLYASVFDSKTTARLEDAVWETHANYADIQTLIAGQEINFRRNPDGLTPKTEYNAASDYQLFLSTKEHGAELLITPACFAIYFPGEAHITSFNTGEGISQPIRKIVFKVHKDLFQKSEEN